MSDTIASLGTKHKANQLTGCMLRRGRCLTAGTGYTILPPSQTLGEAELDHYGGQTALLPGDSALPTTQVATQSSTAQINVCPSVETLANQWHDSYTTFTAANTEAELPFNPTSWPGFVKQYGDGLAYQAFVHG